MPTDDGEWLTPSEAIDRLPFSRSAFYRYLEEKSTTVTVRVPDPPTAGLVNLGDGDLENAARSMEVQLCPPLGGCSLPGSSWHFHEPTVEALLDCLIPSEEPARTGRGEEPCD